MSQFSGNIVRVQERSNKAVLAVILFVVVAIVGLSYVKWFPYYQKAIDISIKHTMGSSIVSGNQPAPPSPSWSAAWEYAKAYYTSVWKAAVLGILLGSLVQVLIPSEWLLRVLGKTSFGSTLIGGIASVPGMMCSCCAAPLAVGLRKKNASIGACLAFWIGNPTINPATLIFMAFVLSWKFVLIRLIFGLILTFGVSYFANRFAGDAKLPSEIKSVQLEKEQEDAKPLAVKWLKSVVTLIWHIVPAYIIAVLLLGAARAWLFPAVGETAGNSILAIIGFAIAGMLFVIPTAAEIPIIQTMMSFGLGTGPAAALLLTLPAVSLPSLLMISKSFPKKVTLFVAGAVVVIGILSGITGMLVL
jgi:hypothetical protein